MLWAYLREEEFDDAIKISGVCAMAVGCLKSTAASAVGTDTLEANKVWKRLRKSNRFAYFPAFISATSRLASTQGSVILSGGLLLSLMTELCDEIARNGFKKILLFNGHGGISLFE